jgi:hypothetical protein
MKRWVRWAARLYPAQWGARYGAELDALMDDAGLRWRDGADVLKGALLMRMTTWTSYWKGAMWMGLAGAIVALAIAYSIPDRFVCEGTLQLASKGLVHDIPPDTDRQIAGHLH